MNRAPWAKADALPYVGACAKALVVAAGLALLAPLGALAQTGSVGPAPSTPNSTPTTTPATTPASAPIEPEVARRPIRAPRYPSRDFEIGLVGGTYYTQNFGSSPVMGLRLGYHVSEDFFVVGQFGRTRVSDEFFRQVLPGGVLPGGNQTLKYSTLALGYNLLPGEAFFGRGQARLTQGYLLAGLGFTDFSGQRKQTIDVGFGLRLFLSERWAVQAEVRDHIFPLDVLGRRQSTQNVEVTVGASLHF